MEANRQDRIPCIVSLGEILIDFFPAELGRKLADVSAFIPKPGGAPANVAVAAAKLGVASAFIGKVGDDAFGTLLMKALEEQGVNISGMRIDDYARTTLAFIAKPNENTAEYAFYRNPGADLMLRSDELDRTMIKNTRVLHIGSLSLVAEPAMTATQEAVYLARSAGALISFDVNYRPSLWSDAEAALERIWQMVPRADLLKVNETELHLLSGLEAQDEDRLKEACQILLKHGPHLVVVTLGEKGSYFCTKNVSQFIPAFKVKTVDAVGCGDAFIAGLLARLIAKENWKDALTLENLRKDFYYANAVGALTATKQGVIPALPTAAEVDAFLEQFH